MIKKTILSISLLLFLVNYSRAQITDWDESSFVERVKTQVCNPMNQLIEKTSASATPGSSEFFEEDLFLATDGGQDLRLTFGANVAYEDSKCGTPGLQISIGCNSYALMTDSKEKKDLSGFEISTYNTNAMESSSSQPESEEGQSLISVASALFMNLSKTWTETKKPIEDDRWKTIVSEWQPMSQAMKI